MQAFLFYFFSGTALLSALAVILSPKPTRALLSLIVTMFSLAVLFILLGAAFLAMVHLIVYAGAVLVLFLFVIMLQGIGAQDIPMKNRFPLPHVFLAVLAGFCFIGAIPAIISRTVFENVKGIDGTVELVGQVLFREYLLPFELTSLLLLLGIFAAVSLAKDSGGGPSRGQASNLRPVPEGTVPNLTGKKRP